MEITIRINTNWPLFAIYVTLGLLLGVIAISIQLLQGVHFDIILLIISLYFLLVLIALYMIQSGTEVAKKALDLQIELEKSKSEKESRAEEDKKCEEAGKEQREHELKLAQLASTIKVEVSNV